MYIGHIMKLHYSGKNAVRLKVGSNREAKTNIVMC